MTILKDTAPILHIATSLARQLLKSVGVCVLMSATLANAQNEKQISYPVAIQAVRATGSGAPAAPVYKAPEPVIRAIDEASTAPPVTRKKAQVSEKKPVTKS